MQNINLKEIMTRIHGDNKPFLAGLTGGIASGKTTVSNMFSEMGSYTIDFDLIAREVVEPGTEAFESIVDYFGDKVLDASKNLDRKALSKIVFNDTLKRKKLENFTHPAIFESFCQKVNIIANKDPSKIVITAVPLLIEGNLQDLFDKIIIVYVPSEIQIKRLSLRDNIDEQDAANILKSQLPIDEKLKFADFIVHNSSDINQTYEQAKDVWNELQAM